MQRRGRSWTYKGGLLRDPDDSVCRRIRHRGRASNCDRRRARRRASLSFGDVAAAVGAGIAVVLGLVQQLVEVVLLVALRGPGQLAPGPQLGDLTGCHWVSHLFVVTLHQRRSVRNGGRDSLKGTGQHEQRHVGMHYVLRFRVSTIDRKQRARD